MAAVEKIDVIHAMKRWGGSFVKALAEAMAWADDDNFEKLKQAFPEYWARYTAVAEQHRDKL